MFRHVIVGKGLGMKFALFNKEMIEMYKLEEALKRIEELEAENIQLKEKLETYKNRNYGGRKKHDEAWMKSYNDFVIKYESGMTLMEIVSESEISRRTAYRYKAYYDEINQNNS